MAVGDIVDNILSEAHQEADKIKKDADQRADEILAKAKQEAPVKKKEYLDRFNQTVEVAVKKIITNANLEAKKIVLVAKQDAVDEVFELAAKKMDKNRLPNKTVVLKDGVKEEPMEIDWFFKNIKLKLAADVIKILNIE